MNRIFLILGLIIYLAVMVLFVAKAAFPKKEEIQAQVPKIEVVSESVFKNPIVARVRSFTQFGQLPVTLDKSQQGKENPFQ